MASVHVSNIAPQTNEVTLKEFFSFCGEIENTKYEPTEGKPGTATITFKRESAAHNAHLVDNTELDGYPLKVELAQSISDLAGSHQTTADTDEHIKQEDKPRAAIAAEYLAHGYLIGDQALQKALDLDKKHGISSRFTSYLQTLNSKVKATDTARGIDTSYGVTDKAKQSFNVFQQYFERAMDTPTGQKVRAFYTEGSKQVMDIHTEALRLKDLKQNETAQCGCTGTGNCSCPKGECKCANCKHEGESSTGAVPTGKQTCNCSGKEGCTCAPGNCACKACGQ